MEQDKKEAEALTDALESGSKELTQGYAMHVTDELPRANKHLSLAAKEALARKATTLTEQYSVDGLVKTWTCVYFGVTVPSAYLEMGVKKVAEILNELAEKDVIYKTLSTPFSIDYFDKDDKKMFQSNL